MRRGGAGGRIVPGDTGWVRGGTYRSQTGFQMTVSGTATPKVTFKQYPGETVIVEGSMPAFTSLGNTAWEAYGPLSSGHQVYRSVKPFPVTELIFYGGVLPHYREMDFLTPPQTHRSPRGGTQV